MTTLKKNFWLTPAMIRGQRRYVVIARGGQEGPN
jgi:hypothetical protein